MEFLPETPADKDILPLVERWVDALEKEHYDAAYSMTEHDPYDRWSPKLIRAVVEGYGLPEPHASGRMFRVTSRHSARGAGPRWEISRESASKGVLAQVRYDLPLNGEWSDLTVTFPT